VTSPAQSALVVIVNYRTGPLVVRCLESLQREIEDNPGCRVCVVDNCSGDDSAAVIQQAIDARGWSGWVELLHSPRNGGFAAGNNVALAPALRAADAPPTFWLLNPDTVVHRGALRASLDFLQGCPQAGIVGTAIRGAAGELWPYAFNFPSIGGELVDGLRLGMASHVLKRWAVMQRMTSQAQRVGWVSGASFFVRREVFERVGLMDEGYFLYYEETDFCRAAQRAGVECWYLPAASVTHIAGQSTGLTSDAPTKRRMPSYWFDSRRRYFTKNHGRLYAVLADTAWVASFALWRVRRRLQRKPDDDPPKMLRDFISHSAIFRA
jgi:N-acetylglucosaminyl-diphospho-decaprenol L-rhamnosyltransferase